MTWLEARLGRQGLVVLAGLAAILVVGLVGWAGLTGGAADRPEAGDPVVEPVAEEPPGPGAVGGGDESPGPGAAGPGTPEPELEPELEPEGSVAEAEPAEAGVVEWASPGERSPVEPVPAELRVPKPEAVRGLYIGSWSAGSSRRLASLIQLADETEINAFVVDIKEALGEVSHRTRVPLARQVGADRNPAIADLRGLVARLRDHGIYPIARIVVFKDPLLAQARPEWSIVRADGSIWADNNGVHWVDPFNRDVWDYNIELAREAVALGFSEIQWDYVRFPDVPQSYFREAVYPARAGRTMAEGMREFLIHARDQLGDLGVPLTADVFGVTTSARQDVGIGQVWELMADVTDVLLPMVYPSHYPRGTWGFPVPNAEPYLIVKRALGHAVTRSEAMPGSATIRPWLQAFNLGQPPYGPEEVRAQIQAVYDVGLTEWILWNPSSRYDRDALLPGS